MNRLMIDPRCIYVDSTANWLFLSYKLVKNLQIKKIFERVTFLKCQIPNEYIYIKFKNIGIYHNI